MRDVVNENDEILGSATKDEIEQKGLICRVAFIVLIDSSGRLVLQQRSANKRFYPLYWSGAAAGHLDAGETYEEAAARELREELGVDAPLTFVGKFYSPDDKEMVGVFVGSHDGPFEAEPAEVARIEFFTKERLAAERDGMKLTSYVERSLPLIGF